MKLRSMLSLGVALFGLGAQGVRAEPEPFHALLSPDFICVPLGATFSVAFAVDSTAQQFNGYEVTIEHDPAILSFQSVAQGSLMTTACPNRFVSTTQTDSTVTYTHVILCSGVNVNGPGELSVYTYTADAIGSSPLHIASQPDQTFYDAGLYVWPNHPTRPRQVSFTDALVVVYDASAVEEGALPSPPLHVWPNPTRERTEVAWSVSRPGPVTLRLFDLSGREWWRWSRSDVPVGPLHVVWSQGDLGDQRLPTGTYFLEARAGAERSGARVLLVR
ncbi:MAG: hypothetical protein IT349_08465 [Candidatus Eisenbacteria bacterium]|nr:hypothetical protein [Candidatus Eisenbacteria bacterium]